jgi:hypothetical protein
MSDPGMPQSTQYRLSQTCNVCGGDLWVEYAQDTELGVECTDFICDNCGYIPYDKYDEVGIDEGIDE